MKTRSIKKDELKSEWYIIDLSGVRLGKAATKIAALLMGKGKVNKADYHLSGDKVIAINAAKIDVHQRKVMQKKYYSHSGFPGGFRVETLNELLQKNPKKIIENAVWGMLPKTKLRDRMVVNLRVYNDDKYIEKAQNPILVKLDK